MTYYSKSAFSNSQDGLYNTPSPPIHQEAFSDTNQVEIRHFPVCEEYIAVGRTLVEPSPDELEQKKWRHNHIKIKVRKKNLHRHYYYNQSNAIALLKFWSAGLRFTGIATLILFFLIGLIHAIRWNNYENFFGLDDIFFAMYFYIPGIIFKYIESRLNHKNGATFNRQTGKVHIFERGVERLYDFKDFIPLSKRITSYKSNPYYTSSVQRLVSGGDIYICLIPNGSLAAGIIEYHFLKHYMDVSRPLPDVLELECYRQYDPVTKTHDEKTGRDPYYWRHMPPAKLNRLIKESRERAMATLGKQAFYAM